MQAEPNTSVAINATNQLESKKRAGKHERLARLTGFKSGKQETRVKTVKRVTRWQGWENMLFARNAGSLDLTFIGLGDFTFNLTG